jgi:ribosomal protein S18 acetylase RimI-like enzyme
MSGEDGQVTVREARSRDADIVGSLIDAMDAHYNGAGNTSGEALAAACARQALESNEGTHFLIAELEGRPVGIACFAVIRPGRQLKGLVFLKDLFVVPEARSLGVGRALMRELARYAMARDIGRIDLTTDVANAGAQRLYEELGGRRQEILRYQYDGDRLRALAGRSER